jgi:hypothetical protein
MLNLRLIALLVFALILPIRSATAQEVVRTDRLPVGFGVESVSEDGRYITLEDGRIWEVEISDRATTGSWASGDFVGMYQISAPRGDYGWLLVRRSDLDQHAAVRLVGHRPRQGSTSSTE